VLDHANSTLCITHVGYSALKFVKIEEAARLCHDLICKDVLKVQLLVVRVDCLYATLSLFVNDASTTCYDIIRSLSVRKTKL
jgi:hypothetical protein